MSWTEPDTCSLCGYTGPGVKRSLHEFPENPPGMRYEHIPKCVDAAACRARVEDDGKSWPLRLGERV